MKILSRRNILFENEEKNDETVVRGGECQVVCAPYWLRGRQTDEAKVALTH